MATSFGKTWWGEQWLNSLNNIDYSNRLPRGSSYARKGAVTTIKITENRINAKVAGSRPKPYSVDIILPPFFEPELSNFIDELVKRPVIISKLLNRELDPEVLSIAESMQLKVFPRQWTDFKMQCSCPDWAVPCKHLAAVIYKVSAEIDNNPFLVFKLHNVDLIEEMNKRGIMVRKNESEIPAITDLYFEKGAAKKKDTFDPQKAYQKLSFAGLQPIYEPLIALLSAHPPFYQGHGDFKEKYRAAIDSVARKAQKIIKGKLSLEQVLKYAEPDQLITVRSDNKISIDENYQARVLMNDKDFSFARFLAQIAAIPGNKTPDYQPSTASLHTVFNLALQLLANGAVVPQIVRNPQKKYAVRWLPAVLSKEVNHLCHKLQELMPPGIFLWQEKEKLKVINRNPASNLLSVFLTELMSALMEKNNGDIFMDLFFRKHDYDFKQPGEEALSGGIAAWLQKYYIAQGIFKPQIVVEETKDEHFLININVFEKGKSLEAPIALSDILTKPEYISQRYEILQSMTQLSSFIPGLDGYINSNTAEKMEMDIQTFTPFLMQMIPAIQLLDIDILLPKSLREILKPKQSVRIKKNPGKSFLRLDKLLDFEWQVAIGDTLMSESDFRQMLKNSEGLFKYKTQYIYVSKEELEKLHRHFNSKDGLSSFQLLRAALSGEYFGAKVDLTEEVRELIRELTDIKEIPLPEGIHASLRPYQHRGYAWMYRNARIGFGSVIADDMGLGKTLQVIAALMKYKEEGMLSDKKALVITPTGLLTNWASEIEKFAPSLNIHIFHGTHRKIEAEYDVLLTSYGVARSEASKLKKMPWHTVVIDEAQNIKNIDTKQTKAIKSIEADNFIAMSGTPVENRLSEMWSIMDFSNRGLLGSPKEFQDTFAAQIETYNDRDTAEKLKKVTAPFMMRRLKTDKSIISDLPDKLEMDCFSTLAKEQASLYEKTLEEAMREIDGIDPTDRQSLFVRQGLVLQMILALKQICNHPAQFLKNNILDPELSGKITLLFDKLDSIVESNEKVLVFTQFAEMGKILQQLVSERYGEPALFYHGGCSIRQRKEMVDSFQNNHVDKIFILSLKAAGTGLNLTRANHVIHYDLWWNPAVEAQATDRAYRIGQKNNVMVHRFITKNTFEERINEMIQSKKALAEMTVATGENWIGNLSNKELKDLFVITDSQNR